MTKLIVLATASLVLASCATQMPESAFEPPGFLLGLWHGFAIFFSLIGHLIDDSIRIYAFPNTGGWYDFGYFIGVGTWCGVLSRR